MNSYELPNIFQTQVWHADFALQFTYANKPQRVSRVCSLLTETAAVIIRHPQSPLRTAALASPP